LYKKRVYTNFVNQYAKEIVKGIPEAKSQKQKNVDFVKRNLLHIHHWTNFVVPIVELKIKSQSDADDGVRNQPKKELVKTTQHIAMGCMREAHQELRKDTNYFYGCVTT
jgi:hypothetical protein